MPPTSPSSPRPPRADDSLPWVAGVLILLGILARFLAIEADPLYSLWGGWVLDEGRWAEQARSLALFGEPSLDHGISRIHLLLAPLHQALLLAPFMLFGVSLWAARGVSALCGVLLMLGVFLLLRRRVTPQALTVAVAVIALQPDLLVLNRIAIPETSALLFELVAFAALVRRGHTLGSAAVAGIAVAVAAGFKATVLPIVPIFAFVIWTSRSQGDPAHWGPRVAVFLATIAGAAVAFGCVLLLAAGPGASASLASTVGSLMDFSAPSSRYGVLAYLFYDPFVASLAPVIVANWFVAILVRSAGPVPESIRALYVGAGVWAAGWIVVAGALSYFPPRYQVHIVVPLAIHLSAGLTILKEAGLQAVLDGLRDARPSTRFLYALGLSLPLAALLGSLSVSVGELFGATLDRLRHHLLLLVVLHALMTGGVLRLWEPLATLRWLVGLPLGASAVNGIAVAAGAAEAAPWVPTDPLGTAPWIGALAIAAAGVAAIDRAGRRSRFGPAFRAAAIAYAVVAVGGWLATAGSRVITPSYTMRTASRALHELIPEERQVTVVGATTALLGTRLRYLEGHEPPEEPAYVVVAFFLVDDLEPLISDYRVEGEFPLNYGEGFAKHPGTWEGLTVFSRSR